MFERSHHQFIEVVLTSLDSSLLREHTCWFGGGTAIALRKEEYRESVDIDFLVADLEQYRALRHRLNGRNDMSPLLREAAPALRLTREWRADQYGIRSAVDIGPRPIKFEIVNEARIDFSAGGRVVVDSICLDAINDRASDRGLELVERMHFVGSHLPTFTKLGVN